jgi:hypothetical protein
METRDLERVRLERAQELMNFYEVKSCRADLRGSFYEVKNTHENKNKTNIGQTDGRWFYEIRKQNNDVFNKQITGQYVQKEFILDIASWISPDFYFKCSKIVNDYFIEQFKKQLEEKDKQLEATSKELEEERQRTLEAKEESMHLKELMASDNLLTQTQIIYIATSPNYALRNRFKVGGVQSKKLLKSRLSTYNSRSAEGDFFYYSDIFTTIEYRQIEERLKCLLKRFKDRESKEMYVMYYRVFYVLFKESRDFQNDRIFRRCR